MRRLRYFTFCAVGAVDVLMLDVAGVLGRSDAADKFDMVFFFDKTDDDVSETLRRIPGAVGFPGDFVATVLHEDPDGDAALDSEDPLSPPTSLPDERSVRDRQKRLDIRRCFVRSFPFDVINLDLEEFLFRPKDPRPGRVVNALRKVFEWEKRPLVTATGRQEALEGFSLMFTTQIGPQPLAEDYLTMLRNRLHLNMQQDPSLQELMVARTGYSSVDALQRQKFDDFFKLAVPKELAAILTEADWYIDPAAGVRVFEFQRLSASGPYKILHLVMDVNRQSPPKERRPALELCPSATEAYAMVTRQIFREPEIIVTERSIDREALLANLQLIKARRRKYCPD